MSGHDEIERRARELAEKSRPVKKVSAPAYSPYMAQEELNAIARRNDAAQVLIDDLFSAFAPYYAPYENKIDVISGLCFRKVKVDSNHYSQHKQKVQELANYVLPGVLESFGRKKRELIYNHLLPGIDFHTYNPSVHGSKSITTQPSNYRHVITADPNTKTYTITAETHSKDDQSFVHNEQAQAPPAGWNNSHGAKTNLSKEQALEELKTVLVNHVTAVRATTLGKIAKLLGASMIAAAFINAHDNLPNYDHQQIAANDTVQIVQMDRTVG